MKNILFASSEVVPFIKTGGLADVVGSLPKYFPKKEYDVRVVLPKYMCMKPEFAEGLEQIAICDVYLNWRQQYCGVLKTERDGITFYFIDNEFYFAGDRPYGDMYLDAEKFGYFSKAVLTILPIIGFQPDVIHCNDWQTGLIPVYLDAFYRNDPFYRKIKTVMTLHNMKFQGRWRIDGMWDLTGLSPDYFTMDKLEIYGEASTLKGGIVFADAVTTVSETYADEIRTPDGGEGLDGLLRAKGDSMYGIVNGLDYVGLNPRTDKRIAFNYNRNVPKYKKENKKDLQQCCGLEVREDAFLISMVSRLTDQKGFDLVNYIFEEMLQDDRIQVVVLGTGEQRYEDAFRYFAAKYPGRVSANIYYDEDLSMKIYAASDAFVMPSLFEPCGLSQLMSLRYGTVPIVRETGGLKDTVEPFNEYENTGTGFSFKNYNAHELLEQIRYACDTFYTRPTQWMDMVKRGMKMDFSWEASSKKYAEIYDRLIEEANEM